MTTNIVVLEALTDRKSHTFGEVLEEANRRGIAGRRTVNRALHSGIDMGILEKSRRGVYVMKASGPKRLRELRKDVRAFRKVSERRKVLRALPENRTDTGVVILKDERKVPVASGSFVFTGTEIAVQTAMGMVNTKNRDEMETFLRRVINEAPEGIDSVEVKIGVDARLYRKK